MTDKEVYDLWLSKTSDLRFLRQRRWEELKRVIIDKGLTSVLEFGSGVSTLLFSNFGLKVLSFETDLKFMNFVKSICDPSVTFKLWNNKSITIGSIYDLALVDGILPRTIQTRLAVKYAKIVSIDDFRDKPKNFMPPVLANYKRIDLQTTTLAIFEKVK